MSDPSFAEPRRWPLRRLLAPFAVGFALLSACLTFVVLTGLTPIEPTRNGVSQLSIPPRSSSRKIFRPLMSSQ